MDIVRPGVLLDNTAGNCSQGYILDGLFHFGNGIGVKIHADTLKEYREADEEEKPYIGYEIEMEFISIINHELQASGLVLTVGEVEPGLYMVESLED